MNALVDITQLKGLKWLHGSHLLSLLKPPHTYTTQWDSLSFTEPLQLRACFFLGGLDEATWLQ